MKAARRAAVLGSPIAHSLSPALHRAAYEALGLDWHYEAIECDSAALPALLAGLDATWVGLSLTMPLKRAVLPLLDDVGPLAGRLGAVNTVLLDGGSRRGENTDAPGMVAAVREAGGDGVRSITVVGGGGTAAAALGAATGLGVRDVVVVVRNRGRAAELLAAAARLDVAVTLVDWPGAEVIVTADLVVSTVPAGAADALASLPLRRHQIIFDVVYHPWPTALARAAGAAGSAVLGGLDLLVHQAALQVTLMTGAPAPLAAMRAAGQRALASR